VVPSIDVFDSRKRKFDPVIRTSCDKTDSIIPVFPHSFLVLYISSENFKRAFQVSRLLHSCFVGSGLVSRQPEYVLYHALHCRAVH
jgi:hypothetical protein